MDLIYEIAKNLQFEGRTDMDQHFSSDIDMRPILQKLEELKNITIIDRAMTLRQQPKWNDYEDWIKDGGRQPANIDGIITAFTRIRALATPPTINAVKSLLDELNYLMIKAKMKLSIKIEEEQDVSTFMRHVYPGKALTYYENLFGDEPFKLEGKKLHTFEIAVLRKKFAEQANCGPTGRDPWEVITEMSQNIMTDFRDIIIWGIGVDGEGAPSSKPVTPSSPGTSKPSPGGPSKDPLDIRFARSLEEARYSGVKLHDLVESNILRENP